ncbi:hypothetical protein BRC99_06865, partial [Halobacteriales archaeon QS_7_69_60]
MRIRHHSRSLRTIRHSFGRLTSVSEIFRIFILPSRPLASIRRNEGGRITAGGQGRAAASAERENTIIGAHEGCPWYDAEHREPRRGGTYSTTSAVSTGT